MNLWTSECATGYFCLCQIWSSQNTVVVYSRHLGFDFVFLGKRVLSFEGSWCLLLQGSVILLAFWRLKTEAQQTFESWVTTCWTQCHIPEDMNVQPLLVVLVGPSSHTWATSTLQDARHHRHWQRVLGQVGGLHLSTLCFPLPLSGTVLGGTMELHGNNISLACFHGINFKSKSWALFSLKEPCISFATEAQEVPSPECKCRALKLRI